MTTRPNTKTRGCEPFCRKHTHCPACNSRQNKTNFAEIGRGAILTCKRCGAVHGTCYKGESPVLPFFAKDAVPAEDLRYFDLTLIGSQGVERTHGWYDPKTRLIHQVG